MIKNSNIVITGSSHGIGRELTIKLLKNGNKVWGCSRKDDLIKMKNYFHCRVNLSDLNQIKEWINKVSKESSGKIDIFISNAAIFKRRLSLLDSFDNVTETVKVNLIASMLITKML